MNTNCKSCDKPDCPHKRARELFDAYPLILAVESNPEWIAILNAMYAAERVCDSNTVNWRDRCLAAESRIKGCAAALAEIERVHPDCLDDYSKGFRHGCQDMIAILYGEP